MIQRYKRLSIGSSDPENVAKYEERLRYWEERKDELEALQEKMAGTIPNDWSETEPRVISKEKKSKLINYARAKGVNIVDLSAFDGDVELLKEQINTLSKWSTILPTKRKVTLLPGITESDDDFGETINRTIKINTKALRNRKVTNRNINSVSGEFASSDVSDIAAHEYGHFFVKEKGINTIEISKEAYYNIYKRIPTTSELMDYYKENISEYSSLFGKKELISEVLARHNSNPSLFTEEIIKLLRKKVTP